MPVFMPSLKRLLETFTMPSVLPVEDWAMRNANKASPDMLIAGTIIKSFAVGYGDWATHKLYRTRDEGVSSSYDFTPKLVNQRRI
jgi:hypothetical protein